MSGARFLSGNMEVISIIHTKAGPHPQRVDEAYVSSCVSTFSCSAWNSVGLNDYLAAIRQIMGDGCIGVSSHVSDERDLAKTQRPEN